MYYGVDFGDSLVIVRIVSKEWKHRGDARRRSAKIFYTYCPHTGLWSLTSSIFD